MLVLLVSKIALPGGGATAAAGSGSVTGSLVPAATITLPGTNVLQGLAQALDGWALIAAGLGIVIGAIMWAFGNYSQNWQQAYNGRRGVMVSALAALLIGGASHIIDFFLALGSRL